MKRIENIGFVCENCIFIEEPKSEKDQIMWKGSVEPIVLNNYNMKSNFRDCDFYWSNRYEEVKYTVIFFIMVLKRICNLNELITGQKFVNLNFDFLHIGWTVLLD